MKTPMPLRNYQQMLRVIRDNDDMAQRSGNTYQLGTAYSGPVINPADTRLRSLDELGLNFRSSRQPEPKGLDRFLPRRASTSHFHQLNPGLQRYFTGTSAEAAPTRRDGWAGTKARAYLGGGGENVVIPNPRSFTQGDTGNADEQRQRSGSTPPGGTDTEKVFTAQPNPNSIAPPQTNAGKQTRLPRVAKADLEGTWGPGLEL